MYSIVCRAGIQKQIKEAIGGDVVFESTSSAREGLEGAARISSAALILDIDAGDPEEILSGVKKFKVAQPGGRIIVLAPGRAPGDRLIAGLVAKGVYDIIAAADPDESEADLLRELRRAIERQPASYAEAVKWDIDDDEEGVKVKTREREKTVYLEKAIGTGRIAVAGVRRGAGSTTVAIAVAHYLASQKKSVAYIELSQRPVAHRVKDLFGSRIAVFDQLSRSEAEAYDPVSVISGMMSLPDYIVLDMGTLLREPDAGFVRRPNVLTLARGTHPCLDEAFRADLVLLTLGTAHWGLNDLAEYQERLKERLKRWDVLVPTVRETSMIRGEIGGKRVHALPVTLDPFQPPEEWGRILAPVLPRSERKNIWGRVTSALAQKKQNTAQKL
jgi:DNA-binding NarL/FixJ family response regulator